MPPNPDEIRIDMLRTKLERTIRNVSEWWGITPDQAARVLDGLRDQVSRERRIGSQPWPDPSRARYDPGTPDEKVRAMAYQAAAEIAGQGSLPSQRNVWAWCVRQGARKRQSVGLRIVREVLADLGARAVAASVVRDVQGLQSDHHRRVRT